MGRTSKILSPAEIRERKRQARSTLTVLKAQAAEQRTVVKNLRAEFKKTSSAFGKAERELNKLRNAANKQAEKIASL